MEEKTSHGVSLTEMADKIDRIYKIITRNPDMPVVNSSMNDYLNFSTTAKLLRCCPRTLHRWKDEGKIPFHKMGHKIYFYTGDIETFINDNLSHKNKTNLFFNPQRK